MEQKNHFSEDLYYFNYVYLIMKLDEGVYDLKFSNRKVFISPVISKGYFNSRFISTINL